MLRRINQINGPKNFYAGLIYIVTGGCAFLWAQKYEIGTATRMGPGYFPALLGIALLAIGVASAVNGIRSTTPDPITKHRLEPLFLVLASIISFALLVEWAGLIVAIFVSVFIACFRRALTNPIEVFLTFLALAAFCGVVFVYLFGINIPLFWWENN